MDIKEFCAIWGLSEEKSRALHTDVWQKKFLQWQGEIPFFLSIEYLGELYPHTRSPFSWEEVLPYATQVIQIARETPAVSLLAWTIYNGEFMETPVLSLGLPATPLPYLGKKLTGFFYFMISLGAFPLMKATYNRLKLPEHYLFDTLAWFGGTMYAYMRAHQGLPGRPASFSWIRNYIDGKLFRIGRLEYLLHPCPEWMPPVFRNRQGNIAVLCADGWRLDDNSMRIDLPAPVPHITTLTEDDEGWTGTPVCPDGKALFGQNITLNKQEWTPVASAWALCPSIHIPSGCRMPFEEVKASMIAAREFIRDYFHRHVPFFCCNSWILAPAWEKLLPSSNIAQFRRQGYAVPPPDWGELGGTCFIFGRDDLRPEQMDARNTIEKAMQTASLNHENKGGVVFFMTDDLEKLGNEYYRRNSVIAST